MAARRRKASKDGPIVAAAVQILDAGRSSKFEYEGAVRHGLRSGFCLDGLPWSKADARASAIVTEALRRIGAERPSWLQGQPEWTQDGYRPITYLLCQRCGKPLPPDAREGTKFCSNPCRDAAHSSFRWKLTRLEGRAGMRAIMAARTQGRKKTIGVYVCEGCGTEFKRKWKPEGYRFCSRGCSAKRKYALDSRPCGRCGQEFYPTRANNRFCSEDCRKTAAKAASAAYHAQHHPPPPERPCAVCGRPFCPAKGHALYCSAACNNVAYRARRRGESVARVVRTCPYCQTEFTPKRNNQKYCGEACRHRARRATSEIRCEAAE